MSNDYENNDKAQTYAKHGIQGTLLLAYREFPALFQKYVDETKIALDYGCGSGRSSRYLTDLGFKVNGVDINEAMLSEAQKFPDPLTDNIHYMKIDSGEIDARKSKYDLIFSTLVFLEFPTLDEMQKIVDDIYRVAKFNGTVIILTVADDFYQHNWVSVKTSLPENQDIHSGKPVYIELPEVGNLKLQDYYWRDEDYRQVFEKAGFAVAELVQPKANGDEGIEWINEQKHAPYSIYVLKKAIALENIKSIAKGDNFFELPNGVLLKEISVSENKILKQNLSPQFSSDRFEESTAEIYMPSMAAFPFHKMLSDETFTHIEGCDVIFHLIDENGKYSTIYLGEEHDNAVKEFTIKNGTWFAEEIQAKDGYAHFYAKNKPGFHPDDSVTLTSKWQLPSRTDIKNIGELLLRFGVKDVPKTNDIFVDDEKSEITSTYFSLK